VTEPSETPDVDALVQELRARIEDRRRDGTYPAELEEDLAADFERVLARRGRRMPDLTEPVEAVRRTLAFDPAKIPIESARAGGDIIHRTVARLVGRQVQGVFEQVGAFAGSVHQALQEIAAAFEILATDLTTDRMDAIYERQAELERALVQGRAPGGTAPTSRWFSSLALEEELSGSFDAVRELRREVATRLSGTAPVIDLACGRGELLDVLGELGIDARGVDRETELVEAAVARGLKAEVGEPVWYLAQLEDGSLGAVALVRGINRLGADDVIDLGALCGRKVRPGGLVIVDGADPEDPAASGAAGRDPAHVRLVHPAGLTFLLRQAGFADVTVEHPAPGGYRLVATR
jgi:hypothetical protein